MRRRAFLILVSLLISVTAASSVDAAPTCFGDPASSAMVGTSGNDELIGTSGPDVIVAKGGNDTHRRPRRRRQDLRRDGNDTIFGGAGFDQIDAGPGSDQSVNGDDGDDLIRGWTATTT